MLMIESNYCPITEAEHVHLWGVVMRKPSLWSSIGGAAWSDSGGNEIHEVG